jgi:hypothetical protein
VEAKKKPFGNRKRPSKLFFCSLLNKKAAKAFFKKLTETAGAQPRAGAKPRALEMLFPTKKAHLKNVLHCGKMSFSYEKGPPTEKKCPPTAEAPRGSAFRALWKTMQAVIGWDSKLANVNVTCTMLSRLKTYLMCRLAQ